MVEWYDSEGPWRLLKGIDGGVYVKTLWRFSVNWETRVGYVVDKAKNLKARQGVPLKAEWALIKIMLIALAKIPEREGSILPPSFYGQLLDY